MKNRIEHMGQGRFRRMKTSTVFTLVVLAIIILLIILLFTPLKLTVASRWRIKVVDEDGISVPGATVKEVWQFYSIEIRAHRELRIADAEGYVEFPRRVSRTNGLSIAVGVVRNILSEGAHAGYGRDAYVIAEKNGMHGLVWRTF